MYILKPISTEQRISFLSRNDVVLTAEICFRDDSTNEVECVRLPGLVWNTNDDNWEEADYYWNSNIGIETPTEQNDYNVAILEFTDNTDFLVEGHFYDIEIKNIDSKEVYFKDRVFVTAQVVNQTENKYYKIAKGDYKTPPETDSDFEKRNDYIIL